MNNSFSITSVRIAVAAALFLCLLILLIGCKAQIPGFILDTSAESTADTTEIEADPTVVAIFQVQSTPVAEPDPSDALTPEPTVASPFGTNAGVTDGVEVVADEILTDTTLADVTSTISSLVALNAEEAAGDAAADDAARRSPSGNAYAEQLIYDDALNPNWTLDNSFLVDYDPLDTKHWFESLSESSADGKATGPGKNAALSTGAVAIKVTPTDDFGALFFTVQPETTTDYSLNSVLGISFWLNSGPQLLDTADLAVAVLGSNELTYWQSGDDSVLGALSNAQDAETFSETRLYFLDINRSIPPDTWTRVFVWLDELEFQPDYEHVTGFYIKTDGNFRGTFYVDQVSLLVLPKEEAQ